MLLPVVRVVQSIDMKQVVMERTLTRTDMQICSDGPLKQMYNGSKTCHYSVCDGVHSAEVLSGPQV
jgi:hypothetical protein